MTEHDDTSEDMLFAGRTTEETAHNRLKHEENSLRLALSEKAAKCKTEGAKRHLIAGVSRRFNMMQKSRFEIRDGTREVTEPPGPYALTDLSIHLNAFYLNLRGAIDNLAWAATYEHQLCEPLGDDEPDAWRFVHFTGKRFRAALARVKPPAAKSLEAFDEWLRTLKNFRDPAAHRVPLTFVGAVLTEADVEKHRAIKERGLEALQRGDIEAYGQSVFDASRVGRFFPILEGPRGPQGEHFVGPSIVASDQKQFVKLARTVLDEVI